MAGSKSENMDGSREPRVGLTMTPSEFGDDGSQNKVLTRRDLNDSGGCVTSLEDCRSLRKNCSIYRVEPAEILSCCKGERGQFVESMVKTGK